jgi:hypothetical protein
MSNRSWFAKLPSARKTGRPGQRRGRNAVPRARLRVESLEDRFLPSTFTVTNTNDSGPGSLRAAITQVNQDTQPGTDTITFAIGSGAQTIVPLTALPTITHPVVINGTTQPGYAGTPLIQLDGATASTTSSSVNGLTISGGNSTVEGLVINRFNNAAIELTGAGGDTVAGNYLGTDSTGTASFGFGVMSTTENRGVYVLGSTNNVIGGTTPGARNVISGNGAGVVLQNTSGNVVDGNYIGTDVTGTQALPNHTGVSLSVQPTSVNTIGGTSPGAGNVISSNTSKGIYLARSSTLVEGNYFGTDASGTSPLGVFQGVDGYSGWTASLSSAVSSSSGITIAGSFASAASTTYTVKFYSSPSGTSQGETYLGSATVTTDATGKASFTATFPITVAKGQVITATATDPLGNTSEFSGSQVVS